MEENKQRAPMKKRHLLYFFAALIFGIVALITIDQNLVYQKQQIALEPAPECDVCANRHQAITRNREILKQNNQSLLEMLESETQQSQ